MTGAIVFLIGLVLMAASAFRIFMTDNTRSAWSVIILFLGFWGGGALTVIGSSMILWATTMGQLC